MHIKISWVQLPRNFKKKVHELPRSGGLQRTDNPLLYNLNPTSIWLLQPRDAVGTWIFLFIPKPKTPNAWTKNPKVLLSCHIAVIFLITMIFHSGPTSKFHLPQSFKKELMSAWTTRTHHSISCSLWNLRQDLHHSNTTKKLGLLTEPIDMIVPSCRLAPHLGLVIEFDWRLSFGRLSDEQVFNRPYIA